VGHDAGSAAARAVELLASLVQREANVLAYIDGFWLCFWFAVAGLLAVACMTRAPAGPLTPEPFKFARMVLRRCGLSAST
jgi:DHA2 family multidrug resistance protein